MGGHQVTSHGSGDDGFDEDGYDESQRAEILEATRDGPGDGTIITEPADHQVVLARFVGGWIGLLTPRAHGLPDWR